MEKASVWHLRNRKAGELANRKTGQRPNRTTGEPAAGSTGQLENRGIEEPEYWKTRHRHSAGGFV
jgi:hypothetical protein